MALIGPMAVMIAALAALPAASMGNVPQTAARGPGTLSVSFDSERIRLAVIGDSLEVRGTYYLLCNRRGLSVSLFYPFPRDSLLGGARMVSLSASVGGKVADLKWEASRGAPGVRWNTPSCTGDTLVLDAVYKQKLLTDYARYIVTTTRGWRSPLRRARFEIRLPPGAVPVDFSFPFEPREDAGGRYYRYEAREFFPDRDITVRWRRAQKE